MKAIPSRHREVCPSLFWARSDVPGWSVGLWVCGSPSPRPGFPGGASRGAPGETGSSRVLGKDGLDSWVGQEWQELPLGSGLGRTVPKSTGDPGRALTGEWLVVTAETSDAHRGGTEGSLGPFQDGDSPQPEQLGHHGPGAGPPLDRGRHLLPGAPLDHAEPCQGGPQASWGLLPGLRYPQGRPSSKVM